MLGKMVEIAGAILFRDSLAISDIPCAVVFVQKAILITDIRFHSHSIRGLRPLEIGRSKSNQRPSVLSKFIAQEADCSFGIEWLRRLPGIRWAVATT